MTRARPTNGVGGGFVPRPEPPSIRPIALPHGRHLSFEDPPLVMGILNVTPDSFSDGGAWTTRSAAIDAALRMESEGAGCLDVGGESTRPGAEPVPVDEELDRTIRVIEGIRARSDVPISIDTTKAAVARAAIEAGADLVNDVSAMRMDPEMVDTVRAAAVPVILMHMRGEPRTMQHNIHYDDLMGEIRDELTSWRDRAIGKGIERNRVLVDPGIGFGKSFEHNLEILARIDELTPIAPVVLGASRKAFVGRLTGREVGPARAAGSLAAVAAAVLGGAAVVRTHDVRETADFLAVFRPVVKGMR